MTHSSTSQALEDAFLAIDGRITTEEVIKELVQIAGRPTEEPPAEKVAEEDDCESTKCYMYNVHYGWHIYTIQSENYDNFEVSIIVKENNY